MSFLERPYGKLHYQIVSTQDERAKPTVVFLHGLVMDNLSSWFFTMANPLSQIARVVLYDLRGHGFSDRPKTGYSIKDHLSDLGHLLGELSPGQPVTLVGNSFGGLLAIAAAMEYPDRIQSLYLLDAQVHDSQWKAGMLTSLGLQGQDRDQLIEKNFENWLGRSSTRKSNRLARNAEELIYKTSLLDDLRDSALVDDQNLAAIKIPCHAIYGQHSDILGTALHLQSLIENFQLQIFPDCTHSLLWEKTAEVRDWLLGSIRAQIPEELS